MTRFGSLPVSGTLCVQTGDKSKSRRPMEKRRIIETAVYPYYVGSGNAAGNNHLMRGLTVEKSGVAGVQESGCKYPWGEKTKSHPKEGDFNTLHKHENPRLIL